MWELAPEHLPGLSGGVLAAIVWVCFVRLARLVAGSRPGWSRRLVAGYDAAPGSVRAAALLMSVTGGVHVALLPGHLGGEPVTSLLFLVDAIAFGVVAVAAFTAWWWRRAAAALLVATVLSYLLYVAVGLEAQDQLGIATKLVELLALSLALVPTPGETRPQHRRLRWTVVAAAVPALTMATGLTVWGADLLRPAPGHQHAGAVLQASNATPTPQQREAATRLLAETSSDIAPYRDWRAAVAAGYRPAVAFGGVAHWTNPAYAKGPVLDPRRPQALVYVRGRSGPILAGAMFQMPRLGELGPDPGGPLTAWHSHQNLCVSVVGFQISLATPYATCPLGAVIITLPAMLHVWTVSNPSGGPFAIDLDPATVRALERS
jgi:hypothetical protein